MGKAKNKLTYISNNGKLVYLGWRKYGKPTNNIAKQEERKENFMIWAVRQNEDNYNAFLSYTKSNTLQIKKLLTAFLKANNKKK